MKKTFCGAGFRYHSSKETKCALPYGDFYFVSALEIQINGRQTSFFLIFVATAAAGRPAGRGATVCSGDPSAGGGGPQKLKKKIRPWIRPWILPWIRPWIQASIRPWIRLWIDLGFDLGFDPGFDVGFDLGFDFRFFLPRTSECSYFLTATSLEWVVWPTWRPGRRKGGREAVPT